MKLATFGRALRWPFLSASLLPYLYGALLPAASFHVSPFILGLVVVGSLHLSANLINDYADDHSGADWQDKTYYGFFGGSKLIQEGVVSARFYRIAAIVCGVLATLAVLALTILLHQLAVVLCYAAILFLAWTYSHGLRLAYHRLGEVVIFLLFGPAVIYGGAFIQLGGWPPVSALLLSLPFGFLTTAILVANEVPDCQSDRQVGKRNLINWIGAENGYLLYAALLTACYGCVVAFVLAGYSSVLSLLALLTVPVGWRAISVLRKQWEDKPALTVSSRLTILIHTLVSLCLIAGACL